MGLRPLFLPQAHTEVFMDNESNTAIEKACGLQTAIPQLGTPSLPSPLQDIEFTRDNDRVSYFNDPALIQKSLKSHGVIPAFEKAGPRANIFHDPNWTTAAVVTCGGLCPGINDVVKGLVNTLYFTYGVEKIYGIPYGYSGLNPQYGFKPLPLDPESVDNIHEQGGSVLGSSRGPQDIEQMVRTLDRFGINVLFTVGGDGTQRGAAEIAAAARKKGCPISVVGIPKTIDNDLAYMDNTFGFETAVYAASPVITAAHNEAKGAYNGIGLVKLMGRHSGFIAASVSVANSFVNFCLVPEVPFEMDGEHGLLAALERRLSQKNHVVIATAEGAGQHLFARDTSGKDASGNIKLQDIGAFLKDSIEQHLAKKNIPHSLKYFDPSYSIRSVPAHGADAIYCLDLARYAVHAAMTGKTAMVVANWHNNCIHLPISLAVEQRRTINPAGQFWQSVLNTTRQWTYFRQ